MEEKKETCKKSGREVEKRLTGKRTSIRKDKQRGKWQVLKDPFGKNGREVQINYRRRQTFSITEQMK